MKLFFDLFPVILFFVAYKAWPAIATNFGWEQTTGSGTDDAIYVATAVIMIAMSTQVAGIWLVKRRVEKMYLFSLVAILVLGGLTLALRDPTFVKWKPTIVNWVLGLVFLASQYVGEKNFVRRMLGEHFEMPEATWKWTNLAWVAFFMISGLLNLVVAFTCEEKVWVNFKLFGLTGLSFVFMIGLVYTLRGYLLELPEDADSSKEVDPIASPESIAEASQTP